MLKILAPEKVKVISSTPCFGSTARVYNLENNEIYKEYLSWIPLLAKNRNLLFLEHLLNLSNLPQRSFCPPTSVVLSPTSLHGYVAPQANGEKIYSQKNSIEEMLSFDEQVREDILEISKSFAIHDINENSIFFSPTSGFNLIDLDAYEEEKGNNSFNNLLLFYNRIIKSRGYHYTISEEMFKAISKNIDYCRLEIIYEVLQKFLQQYNLVEEDIIVRKRTK